MFGKTLKVQSSITLKGKEKDAVIATLKKTFDSDTIKRIFQDTQVLKQEKLTGSKMIIYQTDEYPAFVDATGKSEDFVPSMYVLSEYPQLIQTLKLKEGVEEAVLKGGKALWSQIDNIDNLGAFNKDQLRKIVNSEKKLIALSAVGCDSTDLNKEKDAGIAAYVLHKQGDKLWDYGPQELTDPVIPENYDGQPANQQKQQAQPEPVESESDDDIDLTMITQGLKQKKQTKKDPKPKSKPVPTQAQQQQQKVQFEEEERDNKNQQKPQKQKQQKQQQQQQVEQADQGIPMKVMDEYVRESFMNALKIGINDKNLPIDGQAFYEKYMLVYKRDNIELDIKNSSYQKIGKFLQQMAKDGMIEYKEPKKGQLPQIIKIDRGHDLFDSWEPTVAKGGNKKNEKDGQDKNKQSYRPMVEVTELYLPQGPIAALFIKHYEQVAEKQQSKSDTPQPTGPITLEPLTKEQYISIVNQYVRENCTTENKQKKLIVLSDNILSKLNIKEQEEEEDEEGEEGGDAKQQKQKDLGQNFKEGTKKRLISNPVNAVSMDKIYQKVEEFMSKSHKITNLKTGAKEVKNTEFLGLQIIAEKQHNAQVNRIIGLDSFGFDTTLKQEDIYSFAHIQHYLQQKFNCQVSIHELPGKNAGREIVLATNVFDELTDYFSNEVKIDIKYIHEQNKLGTKKKPQMMKC